MILSFGQHQWRSSSFKSGFHIINNLLVSLWGLGQECIDFMDGFGFYWHPETCIPVDNLMIEWSVLMFFIRAVTNRTALHEYDGVMAISADRCCRQAEHISGFCCLHNLLKTES